MSFAALHALVADRKDVRRNDGAHDAARKAKAACGELHNILVASSDRQERERWAQLLSQPDFCVIMVEDGEAALRAVETGCVDIVVAAVSMPRLDGLEFLRELNKRPGSPRTILIARGRSEMERIYLKAAKLYGAAAAYTQPLDDEDLLSGVRLLLELRAARAAQR